MLKNGLYNAIGAVLRMGLALLAIPLLIHLIGIEEYGLWTLVSTAVSIVSLVEAGLSVSTTVFLSRDLANEDAEGMSQTLTVTVGGMFLLATLAAIGLWQGADVIVAFFPTLGAEQRLLSARALQIGGIVVWARLLQQVFVGVEQAYQRYGLMNILMTVQSLLSSLGLVGVALLGGRTVAMMQWQAVTSAAILIAHIYVVRLLVRSLKLRPKWERTKGLAIARYSLMSWLTSLGGTLFSQADRLIVGAILNPSVLGVYAAITNVTVQINSFSALPIQPLLPTLSSLIANKNINQSAMQQKVKRALQLNATVALATWTVLFLLAPLVMEVMITDAVNAENILAFRIATTIYAIYSINAIGYYILLGTGEVKVCMITVLVSGCSSLLLIATGATAFGLLGAIAGNVGYVGTLLLLFYGMQHLNIPVRLWTKWLLIPVR